MFRDRPSHRRMKHVLLNCKPFLTIESDFFVGITVVRVFSLFGRQQVAEHTLKIGRADIQEGIVEILMRYAGPGNWLSMLDLFKCDENLKTVMEQESKLSVC